MRNPRLGKCLRGLLLLLLFARPAVGGRADTPTPPPPSTAVTVRFDATSLAARGSLDRLILDPLLPWEEWARIPRDQPLRPEVTPLESVWATVATDRAAHVGLELRNSSDTAADLRIEARLPRGLWRVDAAVVGPPPATTTDIPAADNRLVVERLWRMESVLMRAAGTSVKKVHIAPGQTLFVRWTETVAEASAARQRARIACARSDNRVMQKRVAPVLQNIGMNLEALPPLIERGDRENIVRRVHTALLATAKAQAVWQNLREPAAEDQDAAFDALTGTLSEISLAANNLVPGQSLVGDPASGSARVQLSVTNAGPRLIPLVTLGLARHKDGTPDMDRKVFRGVSPGANIAASFTLAAGTGEGPTNLPDAVIQFICGNGAALVPVRPIPPEPSAHDEL